MRKSQIFTPLNIAKEMLDAAEYKYNLYGKKVLEDSFGSGNILMLIVERYIEDCLREKYNLEDIKKGLENDIYGCEINLHLYNECIKRLNNFVVKYNIEEVDWKFYNTDSLFMNWSIKFDYIIGNPPYIKYHEISISNRLLLKSRFKSCTLGNFDYYYAFIENATFLLNSSGKMVYLIPNGVFKNVYANSLREMIKSRIDLVRAYKNEEIFKGVLVTPVMIRIDNSNNSSTLKYQSNKNRKPIEIDKTNLKNKWIFEEKISVDDKKRFGDFFSASMSVATLFNDAYILKNLEDIGDFYKSEDNLFEKEVIKKAASPKSMSIKEENYIIFPYYYQKKKLSRYSVDFFENNFPNTADYLKKYKWQLDNRSKSKGIQWFEYGRSQALTLIKQPKLLLSTLVTNKINVYELDEECIPYSGIFIIPISDVSLMKAREILLSNEFKIYVEAIGTQTTKNSIRITTKDIENYYFTAE